MEISSYNMNFEYWEKRYKEKGGRKTVGQSSWTDNQYDKFLLESSPFLQDVLLKNCKLTSILDFGCGIGRWIPLLGKIFPIYYGTDIIEMPILECKKIFPGKEVVLMMDHTIPFETIDNIWTYVTLQHVIDLNLLKNYILQFYKILPEDGVCVITENSSGNRSNNYISFRPSKVYIEIFSDAGFQIKQQYNNIKNHSTMVFKKNGT